MAAHSQATMPTNAHRFEHEIICTCTCKDMYCTYTHYSLINAGSQHHSYLFSYNTSG